MGTVTSQSLVVGVEAMDDQRGILMDTLNELRQQLNRGNGSTKLSPQLVRLVEFAEMHFGCEESLLRRYGFPNIEEHSAAHQELLDQMRHAVDRAERGADAEFHRSLSFLRGQYIAHVEKLDRKYAEWLNARGVY